MLDNKLTVPQLLDVIASAKSDAVANAKQHRDTLFKQHQKLFKKINKDAIKAASKSANPQTDYHKHFVRHPQYREFIALSKRHLTAKKALNKARKPTE